jgi:hypothetical protein
MPLASEVASVLILEVLFILLAFHPEGEVAATGPDYEALGEDADCSEGKLDVVKGGAFSAEDITKVPFDLEVIADWSNHEEFSPISAQEYLGLIEPCVRSEVSAFGQFLNLLVCFEAVVLYLE